MVLLSVMKIIVLPMPKLTLGLFWNMKSCGKTAAVSGLGEVGEVVRGRGVKTEFPTSTRTIVKHNVEISTCVSNGLFPPLLSYSVGTAFFPLFSHLHSPDTY